MVYKHTTAAQEFLPLNLSFDWTTARLNSTAAVTGYLEPTDNLYHVLQVAAISLR